MPVDLLDGMGVVEAYAEIPFPPSRSRLSVTGLPYATKYTMLCSMTQALQKHYADA